MSFLATLGKAAGSLLGGDAIKDIGNIVDDLHTSGEEKAEAKQKITQILAQAEQAAQAQVSAWGGYCRFLRAKTSGVLAVLISLHFWPQ